MVREYWEWKNKNKNKNKKQNEKIDKYLNIAR